MTEAYPGEQFSLGIQVLDEINRPTSDIIRITDLSDNVNNFIFKSGLMRPLKIFLYLCMQIELAYMFRPSAITLDEIALASINTSFLSSTTLEYGSTRQLLVETLLGVCSCLTL